jgi:hypothetical protein
MVTARAAIALGGTGTRADTGLPPVDTHEQSQRAASEAAAAATAANP